MIKMKKGVALVAIAVLVSAFALYRYSIKVFQENGNIPREKVSPVVGGRNISATTSYTVAEDQEDTLRFTVTIDDQGVITNVTTVDPATNETPEKKKDFNEGLIIEIKGKKLSELGPIDKIGKSSLTTKAFNDALDDLKTQL